MPIELPKPIAAYFQSDQGDGAAVAAQFTEDAVVTDEQTHYSGRTAIRDWKTESSKRYTYTAAPFLVERSNGKTVVTARLVGNFPGSPTNLRYIFVLKGDKIDALEIKP